MAWIYEQGTGRFLHRNGDRTRLVAIGYAGAPPCLNDPAKDHVRQCGPIPKGSYRLRVLKHPRFAAPAIFCDPFESNEMFGRSGFYIHGDNRHGDRTASTGCIILSRLVRSKVADAISRGDGRLDVVEGYEDEIQPLVRAPKLAPQSHHTAAAQLAHSL